MKLHTIAVTAGMALLLGVSQVSFAAQDKGDSKADKKDHPNLKITCDEYLDYGPDELTRTYYWFDAYSWATMGVPLVTEGTYLDWHDKLVEYCTDNKGNFVYEAIEDLD
ncbi:MAG: hypothetical protein KDI01_03940 [Halioglobus sp.]|nr:hypothetical protein [Halioglobus sp.]